MDFPVKTRLLPYCKRKESVTENGWLCYYGIDETEANQIRLLTNCKRRESVTENGWLCYYGFDKTEANQIEKGQMPAEKNNFNIMVFFLKKNIL